MIRKQLGDNAKAPHLIETAATAGYRFIAPLGVDVPHRPATPRGWWIPFAGSAAIVIAALGAKFLLGEQVSASRWFGVLFVCIGVALVWAG